MLKRIFVLLLLGLAGAPARATEVWGDLSQFANSSNIKAFTDDLGGILNSGAAHTGRGLGFAGFDIGFHYAYQFEPGAGNGIMKESGTKAFGMPVFQADMGLPLGFDGFIRGFTWDGLTVAGGGLRYALATIQDIPGVPQLLLVGNGESFSHTAFSGSSFALSMVASVKYNVVQPYVSVGGARTRLEPHLAADPTIIGNSVVAYGYVAEAGFSVRPMPFTYLHAAFAMRHGEPGLQVGLGGRF